MNLDTYATINDLGHGAAIEHAHAQGWTLNTYNDPTADAVEDCTVEYAQECAQADPGLVHMTPNRPTQESVTAAEGKEPSSSHLARVQALWDALAGRRCAHSACSQNYIDTGDTSCVDGETS